jgi:hypothetical protein
MREAMAALQEAAELDPECLGVVPHAHSSGGGWPLVEEMITAKKYLDQFALLGGSREARQELPRIIQQCVDAETAKLRETCEAMQAWFWAEKHHETTTFDERVELCNYAEWLTQRALMRADGKDPDADEYKGVPHMIVWPSVHISRADAEKVQATVERILGEYRAALGDPK